MAKFGNIETFLMAYLARVPSCQNCQLPFKIIEGLMTPDSVAFYPIFMPSYSPNPDKKII